MSIGTLTIPAHINGTQVTTIFNGETIQLATLDNANPTSQEVNTLRQELLQHLNNGESSLNFNVTITVEHSG